MRDGLILGPLIPLDLLLDLRITSDGKTMPRVLNNRDLPPFAFAALFLPDRLNDLGLLGTRDDIRAPNGDTDGHDRRLRVGGECHLTRVRREPGVAQVFTISALDCFLRGHAEDVMRTPTEAGHADRFCGIFGAQGRQEGIDTGLDQGGAGPVEEGTHCGDGFHGGESVKETRLLDTGSWTPLVGMAETSWG